MSKWNASEIKFVNEFMGKHFEMDEITAEEAERGLDFMGKFLMKIGENKFGLMEWDYDAHRYSFTDAWFTDSLKLCCYRILEVEA